MADHDQPHPDLAGYALGVLDDTELAAFDAHLATCARCQAELAELEGLSALLDTAVPELDIPESLGERTLGAVREAAAVDRRRTRRRWLTAVAAAGVLVVGGVAVGVVATRPAAAREIALNAVEGGPPQAHGTAQLHSTDAGIQVDLDLTDLPPNPPGTFYECWFVAPDDTLEKPDRVSAGTFVVASGSTTRLRMFTAANLTQFPRMGITLEPDDGNPQRTGNKVLAGG